MSPSRKTTKCSIYRKYFKRSEGKKGKNQKAILIEQTQSTQSKNNNKKITHTLAVITNNNNYYHTTESKNVQTS